MKPQGARAPATQTEAETERIAKAFEEAQKRTTVAMKAITVDCNSGAEGIAARACCTKSDSKGKAGATHSCSCSCNWIEIAETDCDSKGSEEAQATGQPVHSGHACF
jgi:hypothetical protein